MPLVSKEEQEKFKDANHVTFKIIDDKEQFISEADVIISCVTVATELLFPNDSLFKKGVTLIPVHVRGFQNCDLFFDKVFGAFIHFFTHFFVYKWTWCFFNNFLVKSLN